LHISKFAKDVYILIRKDALKMVAANYLVENISKTPNIKVLPNTEVASATGGKVLETITLVNCKTGEKNTVPAKAVFIYIGQKPGTTWLNEIVLKDENGFILTGRELMKEKSFNTFWKLAREPFMPETNIPGIFASGDVRFTALTGISSAVGEGAMAIRFVRKYLNEM
jgi:thioredoxin reductase (NADPH)